MSRCVAAALDAGPCDNARQLHHVVKQQRIRKVHRSLSAAYRRSQGPKPWSVQKALKDPRLQIVTCWRHHKPIEEEQLEPPLPAGFWNAVAEYGLESELPRYLAERQAA